MWLKIIKEIFDIGHDLSKNKSWYTSKTIWFNILVLFFDLLLKFGIEVPVTGEEIDSIALALAAVGNIALRFRTSRAIVVPSSGRRR